MHYNLFVKPAVSINSLKRKGTSPATDSWTRPTVPASKVSLGLAALFAGTWGAGALIARGAKANGALPWARLSIHPSRQAVWQLVGFWSLQYIIPAGLIVRATFHPDTGYMENAHRRFANALCVAGTGYIMYQARGAQQALRRARFPVGPFWAGRFHTVAAGAFVGLFAAASMLSLNMVYNLPVRPRAARKKGEVDASGGAAQ